MHRSDSRLLLFVFSFLIFAGGLYTLWTNFYASDISVPEESLLAQSPAGDSNLRPINLEVKSVGINAAIVPVGLTAQGAMQAPEGPKNTGWFSLGTPPGNKGSAVIAGHRGFRTGPAVFDNLHLVNPGDEVKITTEEGKELIFVVKEKKIYGATDTVPEVWDKNDGIYLNLITCSGKWNRLTRTSDERLVVFTELKIN